MLNIAWHYGGIHLRGNIPIVRDRNIYAIDSTVAEAWEQQTRQASIAYGKPQIGEIKYRHIKNFEPHIVGVTLVRFIIDRNFTAR